MDPNRQASVGADALPVRTTASAQPESTLGDLVLGRPPHRWMAEAERSAIVQARLSDHRTSGGVRVSPKLVRRGTIEGDRDGSRRGSGMGAGDGHGPRGDVLPRCLGLKVDSQSDDWSEIDANGLKLGLNGREGASHSSDGGAVITFQPDNDIDAEVGELRSKGIEFTGGISDHEWGRIARTRTPKATTCSSTPRPPAEGDAVGGRARTGRDHPDRDSWLLRAKRHRGVVTPTESPA